MADPTREELNAELNRLLTSAAALDPTSMRASELLRTFNILVAGPPLRFSATLGSLYKSKEQEFAAEIDRRFPWHLPTT
jgi:hypothetical protein